MFPAATIRFFKDSEAASDGKPFPWQTLMADVDLTLHAPLELTVDLAALQSELAELDATAAPDQRGHMTEDGSWSSIDLVARMSGFRPGVPTEMLRRMPSLNRLFQQTGWSVLACHAMRLPPWAILPWHFEAQAPHLRECRILLPLRVPQGAITLIGDGGVAYPEGTAWAGDFTFPHQVENRSETERVVLVIDLLTTPEVLRLLPPALSGNPSLRLSLAQKAAGQLLAWRSGDRT